jgi:hypothetical protein
VYTPCAHPCKRKPCRRIRATREISHARSSRLDPKSPHGNRDTLIATNNNPGVTTNSINRINNLIEIPIHPALHCRW